MSQGQAANDDALGDLVARIGRERAEADRRYNEALTRLDRALPRVAALPDAPGTYDEQLVAAVNERWDILPSGPPAPAGGWRGRLAALVWRLVGPAFDRQRAFNAAIVEHLNRNAAGHRQARQATADLLSSLGADLEARSAFDSLLVQFLQQITPFVESKDRELSSAIAELRTIAELSQRAAVMAKREVERVIASAGVPPATGVPPAAPAPAASDAYKYVGFQDSFRGSEDAIRARMREYVGCFAGASDVLDVGCGRGEFLALLKEAGISGRGLDLNHEMVETCRSAGLDAVEGDALGYLRGLADESLGGLFAAQVVEHLEPGYLVEMLETARHKLRPGSTIVLETINAACWVAFFESYIRDLTHVRPLHPETLKFLLLASGYARVDLVFKSPVPESGRLQPIAVPSDRDDSPGARMLVEWAKTFNTNVERLNERLFTHLDYAAIATRV